MARPTKYTEETIQKARDYIANYQDKEDMIPSVAGLAVELGVSRETIYDWSRQEEKKAFSDMLAELLAEQQRILINNGLNGKFNSNITKLVLAQHGMHDKVDQDLTTKGGKLEGITFVPADSD